uniref:Uncharacterized protein n=1 Tax=Nelumbo nucifera TaxID=4432 RepID=A0A822Y972_NELNU|nr:TPA_asm: hypothetical protein HUJ06_029579 [Nelumbo nucifera]
MWSYRSERQQLYKSSEEQFVEQLTDRLAEQSIDRQRGNSYYGDWRRASPEQDNFKVINREKSFGQAGRGNVGEHATLTNVAEREVVNLHLHDQNVSLERVEKRASPQPPNLLVRRKLFQDRIRAETNQNLTFHVTLSPAGKDSWRKLTREESTTRDDRLEDDKNVKRLTDGGRWDWGGDDFNSSQIQTSSQADVSNLLTREAIRAKKREKHQICQRTS